MEIGEAVYNKLFTKILDSSIWLESMPTRIVWLTMIAAMDEQGFVQFASVGNVANRARVSLEEAQEALERLTGPDPNSFDPENEGRRLERVPGGWLVLNAGKHRAMVTRAIVQEQTKERVRRYRMKRSGNASVTPSDEHSLSHSEKIKIVDRAARSTEAFTAFWSAYPKKTGKGAAEKAFARLGVSPTVLDAMLTALQWQINQPAWTKDGGQYIPHASTWLNQRRWEDEPFDPPPIDPRHAPAGKETAAAYSIRSAQAVLDVLEREERDAAQGSSTEGFDEVSGGDSGESRTADLRRLPGRHLPDRR